jgi:hypothetical protein
MNKVSLKEFKNISGLSDRALVHLLIENSISIEYSEEEGILIDIESANVDHLIRATIKQQKEILSSKKKLYMESFASLIAEHLELIVDEAIMLARSQKKLNND